MRNILAFAALVFGLNANAATVTLIKKPVAGGGGTCGPSITFFWNGETGATTTSPYTMTTSGGAKECSGTTSCSSGDTTGTLNGTPA